MGGAINQRGRRYYRKKPAVVTAARHVVDVNLLVPKMKVAREPVSAALRVTPQNLSGRRPRQGLGGFRPQGLAPILSATPLFFTFQKDGSGCLGFRQAGKKGKFFRW